jgi:hypothetical protein
MMSHAPFWREQSLPIAPWDIAPLPTQAAPQKRLWAVCSAIFLSVCPLQNSPSLPRFLREVKRHQGGNPLDSALRAQPFQAQSCLEGALLSKTCSS